MRFSGSGGLSVAIWRHEVEGGRERYAVRLDRSFRGEGEAWQTTAYLRDGDLLRAQRLLEQADAWIEEEKRRQRGSGGTASA